MHWKYLFPHGQRQRRRPWPKLEAGDEQQLGVDVPVVVTQLRAAVVSALVRLVDAHQRHHGQVVVDVPFGIQIDFVAIGVAQAAVDGVVVEVQRAEVQVLQRRDFQPDVLDARVGVERPGVVCLLYTSDAADE